MKPVILYPIGGGGQWLSNLIYSLHNNEYNIIPSSLNFHGDRWTKSDLIDVRHWPNNQGPTDEPHSYDVFSSRQSQFIAFINGYVKRWTNHEGYLQLAPINQFFHLSNDARWRLGSDSMFNTIYLDHITLDADLLFLDPKEFANQLFKLLEKFNVKFNYDKSLDFVLQSIDNFRITCHPQEHFGHVESFAWLAWCHALTLENNIPLDVNIVDDFNGFMDFVYNRNEQFKELTQQQFIIKL